MSTDVLDEALVGAAAAVDVHNRIWILGVGRLVEAYDAPEFSEDDLRQILSVAADSVVFPSGPVRYLPQGYQQQVQPEYRLITYSSPQAPHLQMTLGLGASGFAAVALTRSGVLPTHEHDPCAVLLTDLESILADTFTLSVTTAAYTGYFGPIEMAFAVSGDGPGSTPNVYTVDGESGELICAARFDNPLPPLYHGSELTADSTIESLYTELLDVAAQAAQLIGVDEPQLLTPAAYRADFDAKFVRPVSPDSLVANYLRTSAQHRPEQAPTD
ncbi:hypothetical protein [Gephyromycinifex aptenodytis]|uniref:hypothetical protein n=1 Tax=Gephyromycinifex aptenodytis TaxID=2716227 RepID=UPI001444C5E0|nr:hypothetical protein [Gephyromycinifex aptenodytis]